MSEVFRVGTLIVATMMTGMVAGMFVLYAHTIMPGLGKTDDRTFIAAFQSIDRAIINPWFMAGGFIGSLVFIIAAGAFHLQQDWRSVLPWIVAALVLYLATFVITIGVNVPLNDRIKGAGNPDSMADLAAVRAQFDEAKWNLWNLVRSVTTTLAFGCLVWALILHGRLT